MKLITPCCKTIQDYKGKFVKSKRRTTKCKNCEKQFDIKEEYLVKIEEEGPEENTNFTQKTQFPLKKPGVPSNGGEPTLHTFEKVDDDMIETLILDKANSGEALSDNFIKTCIYFYKDIRGKDDKIKEDIDMEDFKLIGAANKDSG